MKKELNYKMAMEELEQLAAELENDEISVDELTPRLQRASELIAFCQARLRNTEEEVKKILDKFKNQGSTPAED